MVINTLTYNQCALSRASERVCMRVRACVCMRVYMPVSKQFKHMCLDEFRLNIALQ